MHNICSVSVDNHGAAADYFVSSINNDCFAATHRCSSVSAVETWPKVNWNAGSRYEFA